MTKFCPGQARNAIKMKVKWGKKLKNCARKLWFLCSALNNISTIMHIKFEHVQAVDDKVISRQAENAVKFSIEGK